MNKKAGWIVEHRALFFSLLVVAVLLLIFGGTKLYLFAKFILGNDIVVSLDADKSFLDLKQGQKEQISFKTGVTANPFCKPVCEYVFKNMGSGNIIESEKFTLHPGVSSSRKYEITAPSKGEGLEIYRFSISCHTESSFLCNTLGQTTTRDALITVKYGMTEEELSNQENIKNSLASITYEFSNLKKQQKINRLALISLELYMNVSEFTGISDNIDKNINSIQSKFTDINRSWTEGDFKTLLFEIDALNSTISFTDNNISKLNRDLGLLVSNYNSLFDMLVAARNSIIGMKDSTLLFKNQSFSVQFNELILAFNEANAVFTGVNTLQEKNASLGVVSAMTNAFSSSLFEQNKKETLQRELEADVIYDVLCSEFGECYDKPSINERIFESSFNLVSACARINEVDAKVIQINKSFEGKVNYSESDEFWSNVDLIVKNAKQEIINSYYDSIKKGNNSDILKELLIKKNIINTKDYLEYELSPAFAVKLAEQMPAPCTSSTADFESIDNITASRLSLGGIESNEFFEFIFENPKLVCCLFGNCTACCVDESCRTNNATYPVILIHGHAFNKGLTAEYSLENFNKIQKKLEEDGFLNAGAITLYTTHDSPEGIWGMLNNPLSLKVSYYYDLFKQPENYVVVQTNSENIDTYAIRINDLINTIKYRTGKDKVNIIAFSMGGLVSRRYIQIFGEGSVNKLILIATPNKGVTGDTANYCDLVGANLECRDMKEGSLFLNKLNAGKNMTIPVYNIIGTGCNMNGKQGDGIATEDSVKLDSAENFVINGTCNSAVLPLHLALLDTDLYPEVYGIIRNALK